MYNNSYSRCIDYHLSIRVQDDHTVYIVVQHWLLSTCENQSTAQDIQVKKSKMRIVALFKRQRRERKLDEVYTTFKFSEKKTVEKLLEKEENWASYKKKRSHLKRHVLHLTHQWTTVTTGDVYGKVVMAALTRGCFWGAESGMAWRRETPEQTMSNRTTESNPPAIGFDREY